MQDILIKYNTKKRVKLFVIGICISLLGGILTYVIIHSNKIAISYLLAFALIGISGIIISFVQVLNMLKKDQVGLFLNNIGILFKGTSMGRSIGTIKWEDITSIKSEKAFGTQQLFLRLKDDAITPALKKNKTFYSVLENHGFPVNATELDVDFHKMEALIIQYYHHYNKIEA